MELGRVLELIVKRGRALVHARASPIISSCEGDELVVSAAAGELQVRAPRRPGSRWPGRSAAGAQPELPLRLSDVQRAAALHAATTHVERRRRRSSCRSSTGRARSDSSTRSTDKPRAPSSARDDEQLLRGLRRERRHGGRDRTGVRPPTAFAEDRGVRARAAALGARAARSRRCRTWRACASRSPPPGDRERPRHSQRRSTTRSPGSETASMRCGRSSPTCVPLRWTELGAEGGARGLGRAGAQRASRPGVRSPRRPRLRGRRQRDPTCACHRGRDVSPGPGGLVQRAEARVGTTRRDLRGRA